MRRNATANDILLSLMTLTCLGIGALCFWGIGHIGTPAAIAGMVTGGIIALLPLMFWNVDSQRWEVTVRSQPSEMRKAVVAKDRLPGSEPIAEGRVIENRSGMGNSASIPIEIRGWNWGAFFLTWIWGFSHGVWISLVCFIPLVNIVMPFVLGATGNEWAWQNRRWDSIEHFKRTQRRWAWWGLGVSLAVIVLCIVVRLAVS